MKGRTHAAFSLFLSLASLSLFRPGLVDGALFLLSAFLSSFLPDIDDPRSTVGRRLKLFSWPFRLILGHRGLFHSLLIPAFLAGLAYYFGFPIIAWGLLLGYLSHLFLDALTHAGIRPLYPLPFALKGAVQTGGIFDILLFLGSVAGTFVIVVSML